VKIGEIGTLKGQEKYGNHAHISLINNDLLFSGIVCEHIPRTDEVGGSIPLCSTISTNEL